MGQSLRTWFIDTFREAQNSDAEMILALTYVSWVIEHRKYIHPLRLAQFLSHTKRDMVFKLAP